MMTIIGILIFIYIAYSILKSFKSEGVTSKNKEPEQIKTQITPLQLAIKAGERGMELEKEKKYEEALDCYDAAIRGGVKCYAFRAGCLASLDWHFDAIDDYTNAIMQDPADCNLYFLRSESKWSVGDKTGLDDLKTAIVLSMNNSESSIEHNKNAKILGLESATALYEATVCKYPEDKGIGKEVYEIMARSAKIKGRRIK